MKMLVFCVLITSPSVKSYSTGFFRCSFFLSDCKRAGLLLLKDNLSSFVGWKDDDVLVH